MMHWELKIAMMWLIDSFIEGDFWSVLKTLQIFKADFAGTDRKIEIASFLPILLELAIAS